ncbi:hypothetical protein JZ751_002009 [Albula glossodonta]|uniref:Uncharacterized protein n=1 Tax=Albula glossodonta TaxID=121402 RepID=A0A8T2P6V0_9TELE|nr:hypothetical protein JZ751_002009 [Albula glossodonta]
MSYYMDPVPVYPVPHPSDRLDLMRQSGSLDITQQASLIGTCQSQHHFLPRPLYPHEVTLQEVPNGPELCPPGKGAFIWNIPPSASPLFDSELPSLKNDLYRGWGHTPWVGGGRVAGEATSFLLSTLMLDL